MKITTTILFIALLINVTVFGQTINKQDKDRFINYKEIKKYPLPEGYINDYENLFTIEQKQELDSIITNFSILTTNQICIVTVQTYEPYGSMKDLTTDLGNFWGVGKEDEDNGLIINISKNKRAIWIGTGLGTEKVLTDEIITNLINTKMLPFLKEGNYFKGVKTGLQELIKLWK